MLLLYCRYTICRDDLDVWNCALRRYSANMGYIAMTIHVKNSFGSPPQNKNDWVHSVIFEPQPKMILTRSTYKITSFLDFQPFLQGFQSVDAYIKNLMIDIANPAYLRRLVVPFHNTPSIFGTNNMNVLKFLKSPGCADSPYACHSKL